MKLYVHNSVEGRIDLLRSALPQALLLTGARGVGLKTTAQSIAQQSTIIEFVEPTLLTKASTIPVIGIETIRNLYAKTRSKSVTPNVVIIDDADVMTREAQNSFLKLLEEPTSSTHFILTSHRPELLLPTVRSRLQSLYLPNISMQSSHDLIDSIRSVEATKLNQILFIAEGLPAEITRLLKDDTYFTATISTMGFAKKLIESSFYERIQYILSMKSDKVETMHVIRRCVELLSRSPSEQSLSMVERLLEAEEAIAKNGNARLHLVNAVI